jgi:hypothetical protein|nr:MAG TPA: hypothetical protein [Caudoviricetes sp.]
MKKTYLDKYPYTLERLPHRYSDRVDVIVRIEPLDSSRATDLLLNLGSTVHYASIEGMPFKVKDQFTDPSDMEEGKLRITLSGYQL